MTMTKIPSRKSRYRYGDGHLTFVTGITLCKRILTTHHHNLVVATYFGEYPAVCNTTMLGPEEIYKETYKQNVPGIIPGSSRDCPGTVPAFS